MTFNTTEYIFTDFDGTISKYDVIHRFITSFSKGDWTIAEKQWEKGEISTKDCLKIQFDLITELTKEKFEEFLDSIEIDSYFVEFCNLAKKYGKKVIITSDGYDIFIKSALKKYNLDLPIYSNKLFLKEENGFLKFEMEYPNENKNCKIKAGCCKCEVAKLYTKDYTYIGDGLSDRCIALNASLLFAKKSLETFLVNEKIPHNSFKTFQDIIKAVYKENCNARCDVGTFK